MGRLYHVDMRLRPTGKSGSLVVPLAEFCRYYGVGQVRPAQPEQSAQVWERQALTRARVVFGDAAFGAEVMEAVRQAVYHMPWRPELADEIRGMRERLEASRSERDLKRGFGGMIDVEFLIQLFKLKYGRDLPALQTPNTWEVLDALEASDLLSPEEYATLRSSYDFMRLVESRLRIVHNRSLDELPEAAEDLEKLAWRLGFEAGPGDSAGEQFLKALDRHLTQTRELFLRLMERERSVDLSVRETNPRASR
jgi:glutamate-ammonia-ligase adenylyltransferase